MPDRVGDEEVRLPASYTNFYIGNRTVLVPVFGDENDERALAILKGLFPDRDVVGIDCRAMVFGLGTIHCISQQPACGGRGGRFGCLDEVDLAQTPAVCAQGQGLRSVERGNM